MDLLAVGLLVVLGAAGSAQAGTLDLAPHVNRQVGGTPAVCFKSQEGPGKLSIRLAVGADATEARLRTVVLGEEPFVEGGVGLSLTAAWAGGASSTLLGRIGQEIDGDTGEASRRAPPVGGEAVTEWIARFVATPARMEELVVEVRNVRRPICLLEASVGAVPVPALAGADWYPFPIRPAVPLPAPLPVEAPAGKRGFVSSREGQLWFEDGTRARFWGVNLVAKGAVPPKAEAEAYADTLVALGFNLVRLHHIDGPPPRGLLDPRRVEGGPPFAADRLDELDFFWSKLRERGIYLLLEVATEREFLAVDGVADPGGAPLGHKLYPMWEDDWNRAYLDHFRALWGRRNAYTGLRYADDPGVALVELSNEHSLLLHWGFGLEKVGAAHLDRLEARWTAWLRERYGDDAALAAAWGRLKAGESVTGRVLREPLQPAQLDLWPAARRRDLATFYAELERRWFDGVEAEARALGFRVPTIPSITYAQPRIQLLQEGWGVADVHVAVDPPGAAGRIDGRSLLAQPDLLGRFVTGLVAGRASVISELSAPGPNPTRAEAPLLWAGLGARQDWDALVWLPYADAGWERDVSGLPSIMDLRTSPVLLAQMPAASALFRSGWVPPAEGRLPLVQDPAWVRASFVASDLRQRTQDDVPLPVIDARNLLDTRIRTTFGVEPDAPASPGPLRWDPVAGRLLVDTPRLRAVVGPAAGGGVPGLDVRLDRFAAVSLTALDGGELGASGGSRRALLVVATAQANTGQALAPGGQEMLAFGRAPVLVAPVSGTVRFSWPGRPRVVALGPAAEAVGDLPVRRVSGAWEVRLDGARSLWFEVSSP